MNQTLQAIEEFVIPKKSARAFELRKSQILRIIAIDGPQVADLNAFNFHNLKEHFSSGRSRSVGESMCVKGQTLYSIPGHENAMMTVIRDPVGVPIFLGQDAAALFTERNMASMDIRAVKNSCQRLSLPGVLLRMIPMTRLVSS